MPDLHTFCRDLDSSVEEFKKQYQLSRSLMDNMGLRSFLIFRTTQDFWAENKNWILDLIEEEGQPAFLELWEDRYYYFILKFERPVLSAQNRSATLATIQIDVESSLEFIEQDGKKRQKYNISFMDDDGQKKYPIILHTSPAGGLERIVWGLLENVNREIEHKVPGFKTWLSPVQVRILTISKDQEEYAEKIMEKLNIEGYRTDFDDRDESLGKKIRKSEIDWIPYTIIIGDKEMENNTISIRKRRIGEEYGSKKGTSKQINNIQLEELFEMLREETKGFPNYKLPKPFRRFSTKIYFRK
ncbi:MAG: hypothetical protein EU550_03145 [Promethearchaeota archaeon]|nr:MAG: hypothetical protein EU550_03145 [Candidatus Lokiarchaeota archaeon]